MDKWIMAIIICYMTISIICLEQDVRGYKDNYIKRSECYDLIDANSASWKKAMIQDHIKEIKK
jgi:hypothetical protein